MPCPASPPTRTIPRHLVRLPHASAEIYMTTHTHTKSAHIQIQIQSPSEASTPSSSAATTPIPRTTLSLTIIPPHKRIPIAPLLHAIDMLLALLQRNVHVSVD